MIITSEEANEISNIANSFELNFKIQSYSGRAMYGKYCFAVVTDKPNIVSAILFMALTSQFDRDVGFQEKSDIMYALLDSRQDSMGFEYVVYFPNIYLEETDEDE